jgi:hypothetical protein
MKSTATFVPRISPTALSIAIIGALSVMTGLAHAQPKPTPTPKQPAAKATPAQTAQVVKPPIAMAYIDVATASSDIPGMGALSGALQGAQGAQGGGLFGALGGAIRGAKGEASGRGNIFGSTSAMGFGVGKFVDVSVYTNKNRTLTEANQAIPSLMNLGESLKLVAPIPDKPVPVEPTDETPIQRDYERPKGKISIYWGCGDTIRPGQPRTLDMATASIEDYSKFFVSRGSTTRGARSQPGNPAWPNKEDDRKVPDNASLIGQHTFTGEGIPANFKVNFDDPQDLMPPIALTQQKMPGGGVNLSWQSLGFARGYFVSVMGGAGGMAAAGGRGKDEGGEMVIWTSSELPDFGFALIDFQSNANVEKWIKEKVILPPSTTTCAIPQGIFGESGGGILRMIAYGSETFFAYPPRPTDVKKPWEPEWQAKVRTKSTLFSMLGGLGGQGDARRGKQDGEPKEEKKAPNAKDLLRGLFGR